MLYRRAVLFYVFFRRLYRCEVGYVLRPDSKVLASMFVCFDIRRRGEDNMAWKFSGNASTVLFLDRFFAFLVFHDVSATRLASHLL